MAQKQLTTAIPLIKFNKRLALAELVVGYEPERQDGEVDDGDGNMIPNMIPQTKEEWFIGLNDKIINQSFYHMRKLKRNIDLGEVPSED